MANDLKEKKLCTEQSQAYFANNAGAVNKGITAELCLTPYHRVGLLRLSAAAQNPDYSRDCLTSALKARPRKAVFGRPLFARRPCFMQWSTDENARMNVAAGTQRARL
jgi:hypothetical protein